MIRVGKGPAGHTLSLDLGAPRNFAEVRNSWRNSDVVGRFVVFDISHNKCRLIATIKYRWGMVYIRRILGHAEYDEKEWQK
jgi:mRNA interferase HigB